MTRNKLPTRTDLQWPTLKALERRGGSASIHELSEQIARDLELSDDILDVPHRGGPRTKVDYRLGWARTDLKQIGAIDNPSRSVWTITELGKSVRSAEEVCELVNQHQKSWRQQARTPERESDPKEEETPESQDWRDELLGVLRGMTPDAFERLCQRLLRESGFTKVEVTGRIGDGGIDGAGVLRVELISFHVRFQCKRYRGSVGSPEIRDFRGAMVGRADKGLFITTGRFTREAEREAVRDGATAIDLIDGVELCDQLKKLELGVVSKVLEEIHVRREFFEGL